MRTLLYISHLLVLGLLQSCAPISEPNAGASIMVYSTDEYMQLNAEQKYALTSKLLATLYKGKPVKQFFDLSKGMHTPVLKQNIDHLAAIRRQLNTPVGNLGDHVSAVFDKHFYNDSRVNNTRAIPMALLYELPLSKEYYHRWIAYVLSNTILFSPALELDSVANVDVETVYNNLVGWLDQGMNISEIVYEHMISEENWRRFRSPEDNTREMMEIYLMRFRDDEVPLASIACKNWFLTDANQDFQLRKTANVNSEPQSLLERNDIIRCEDFYQAVSGHTQLKPAISRRIVDALFAEYPVSKRSSLTMDILRNNPIYFQNIFNDILFSRDYLFDMPRTKGYEEALFGTGSRIYWYAHQDTYARLNDNNPGSYYPDLQDMRQATMSSKLGRSNVVAQDSLAASYYHKSIRNTLMLDRRIGTSTNDGGWNQADLTYSGGVRALSNEDFIHYLMLSTLGRKAHATELSTLLQIIIDNDYQNNRLNQTWIILDYASRLTEFYVHKTIGGDA